MLETKEKSEVEHWAGYLIKRVSSQVISTLTEALAPLGLRVTEATVLYRIAMAPKITSSEVGRSLGIKRANMTPLVARLTELGYLRVSAQDGRSQGLSLTESGENIFEQVRGVLETHDETFFAVLNRKERAQLLSLLDKLFRG